jgi:indole-3-glycerol phosphate synthase
MRGMLLAIIEHKRKELAARKEKTSFAELEALVAQAEAPRNFFASVTQHPDAFHTSVIAEIKRKSPSAGWIRPEYQQLAEGVLRVEHHDPIVGEGGFDPAIIAKQYHANGAAAISCLTDHEFFAGHLGFIERIKEAVPLPVLRKDFIIDPWQLWESRAAGADAVLLIAECLTISELLDLLILAQRLGLTTLVEVHSVDSLLRIRPHVAFPHPSYFLLGINNRDLDRQKVDVNHTLRLLDMVDDPSTLVSESGITNNKDLAWLRHHGVRSVLVGEHLMRSPNPGKALAELLGRPAKQA